MAAVSHTDPKRKYSWWWDSHISPKNSKWLQENLTGMDSKVKQMIKLIEEDADSFARRAEMYYKKRPELMKLVEEFYRAYRALAERYDHATGALRQAHRTMSEAFPNQVPFVLGDDVPAGFSTETDPHTPEMASFTRAIFDLDELQKDASGASLSHLRRNGAFTEESDSVTSRKGLKQLNDLFGPGESVNHAKFAESQARKGLNFHYAEKETSVQNNGNRDSKAQLLSESELMGKADAEIFTLKKALAKLEAEKEVSLVQYQKSLERLSTLESEVSRAQQNSRGLNERASNAEAEVQTLKEALNNLEAEREASFLQYEQSLEKISNLENSISSAQKNAGELNERAGKAETEAASLKEDLARVEAEKEAALVPYKQSLEMLSNLEFKLVQAEEEARRINQRANKAENEIETLKQEIAKLMQEKEDAAIQYQQSLETISHLEHKISLAEEEAKRLHCVIDDGVEKLKSTEERCILLQNTNQSLQSEVESLLLKMGSQSEELTEKQMELGRLWTCIQDERLRFMEAETAFQTLQHLHSQSQEELRSLAAEFHSKAQLLEDVGTRNQILENEVQQIKDENKILNEVKLSSALSINNLQDEILNLRETIRKLEDEVELRVDQRNALQQEIYCLKEELNALNNKHCAMLEQVESVGSDPDCFVSFVKSLQEENSMLKQSCEAERSEKITILEKLETMEKLMEKNSVLENSLSDLNVELEGVRGKVKVLEELCGSLLEQKSTLVTEKDTLIFQLQIRTENLKKLSEENNLLENSLFDVNAELEGLRIKSKSLEDLCLVLDNDKSSLISEKESLVSQLNITQQTLINLEQRCNQLELEHLVLETGRESSLQKVEELLVSLYAEREEHSKFVLLSESQLADRDLQIHLLSEDGQCRKKEYEEELDKAVNAQIEIFVLQKCVQDLKENNFALVIECQKLLDASNVYEKVISELEHENLQKQDDVKSLSENIRILRIGLLQVLETLGIDSENLCENKIEQDQMLLNHIYCELRESQNSLITICNENQELVIEKSVLVTILEQLKQKVKILVTERHSVHEEFRNQSNQFLSLKEEAQRILENNEELRLRIMEGDLRVEELETEAQNLWRQLSDLQGAHKNLQEESCMVFEERRSLIKTVFDLGEDKSNLEKEICVMLGETISQDNVSLIYKNIVFEKLVALKELSEDVDNLCLINKDLEENLKIMMGKLQDVQMENSHLSESLEKSDIKVKSFNSVNDKLTCEITIGREKLSQKENELLEAKRMLGELQNERMQLQKMVEDLETRYDEARVILEDQQKQILKLSSEKDRQNEELECLCEVNQNVESKMRKLHDEFGDAKVREEKLNYELQKGRNEIELWETQAATLYGELQISSVNETLFKEKVHELQHTCESLESRSISKGMEIELLKERLSTLEGENGKLHGQLAVYVPAISSLKDSIKSLENQALIQTKLHEVNNNEESKDDKMASHLHAESGQQTGEDQITVVPDALSDFNNLLKRIVAIERAVIEIERKHVTAVEEARNHWDGIADEHNMQKSMPDVSQSENEVLTKDIMLDQMSECSSYRLSRRGTIGANDQMLELWETNDKDGSVDLNVGKVQKGSTGPTGYHQMEQKNRYPSADSLIERELSVDKLEISGRHPEPCEEGNGRKTLERLDSDAQKLTNLQITIQDLKRKVEITDKSKHGKGIELDTVNGQLEDAQAAIKKLLDANRKLMKNVEDGSLSFDEKPAIGSDESGSVSRRRVSDQARRGSEKIGRLQLEVQRLQFLLLKLDDEKESRGKTKITERKTSVLLRDYLYGASRTKQKGKKASFCACVQPATKGD